MNKKTRQDRPNRLYGLKAMTYNIHSCINTKGQVDLERIVNVIVRLGPDVLALQEVDSHMARSYFLDQPKLLAERLNMNYQYFPLIRNGRQKYGLAILSRYPMEKVKHDRLMPAVAQKPREPRGAMWSTLLTPERPVNIVNTHLGLSRRERLLQIRTLFGKQWGLGMAEQEPLIFCGDLNAVARSVVYGNVPAYLSDVQKNVKQPGYPKSTFPSWFPMIRIDYIFASDHFRPVRVHVPHDSAARTASDHLPVHARLHLNPMVS